MFKIRIFIAVIISIMFKSTLAYQDIDDFYDYDSMLKNRTELHHFVACFLDKEPCTETSSHIKTHLHEQVLDSCGGCDIIQKHYAHAFFEAMKKTFPDEYLEYRKKYDPDGNHFSILEKAIANF